eukprot:scaffold205586_cov19-Tisochrysis_lutea.AAC.1
MLFSFAVVTTGAPTSDKPQPATMRWLSPNGWAAIKELQVAASSLMPDDKLLGCMKAKVCKCDREGALMPDGKLIKCMGADARWQAPKLYEREGVWSFRALSFRGANDRWQAPGLHERNGALDCFGCG